MLNWNPTSMNKRASSLELVFNLLTIIVKSIFLWERSLVLVGGESEKHLQVF